MGRIVRREEWRRGGTYYFWRLLLVVAVGMALWDFGTLLLRLDEVRTKARGIGKIAATWAGQQAMGELLISYGLAVGVLLLLMYLTRGQKVIIEETEEDAR